MYNATTIDHKGVNDFEAIYGTIDTKLLQGFAMVTSRPLPQYIF